jgi:hypothetical protein
MQDLSGSIAENRVPKITRAQLEGLLDTVLKHGGELGFGVVQEQSDRTLVRFSVEELPPPLPPKPHNPLYQERWKRERQQAEQAWASWEADHRKKAETFLLEAEARMQARLSRTTDICGAIRRCDLMLAEPAPRETLRVLLLVSDGLHNVRKSTCPSSLAPGTTVLLVNGAGLQGVVQPYEPTSFESIEAVIKHLKILSRGGQTDESH